MEHAFILFFAALAAIGIAFGVWRWLSVSRNAKRLAENSERAAEMLARLASETARADAVLAENSELKAERAALIESKIAAEKKLSAAEERAAALAERIANRAEEERALREKFAADFENLSNRIFEAARGKMTAANAEQVGMVLAPLKSSLGEFRERVEKLNETSARNNASMGAQIESLLKMNTQLGDEARNLTAALRSNNKVAGNWGEAVLARIFESCGFMEGIHFRSQKSYADTQGEQKRLMPDYVVYLPDSRSVVVDSKLSLPDFVDYCSATDAAAKRAALTKFKKSVREHLNEFAKKYNDLPDITCGFKVMFVPVEGAYSLIVEEDKTLIADAYAANVLVAGPSEIMTVLKFAEIAYRNEAFAKNLREICNVGRLLHERVELFSKRFEQLGNKITTLQKDYDDTRKTLSQGGRSVLDTAKRFIEKSKNANIDFEESEPENER